MALSHSGCWACGSQSLSGRQDESNNSTSVYACVQKVTLNARKDSNSLTATLVANVCSELGGLNVAIHHALEDVSFRMDKKTFTASIPWWYE